MITSFHPFFLCLFCHFRRRLSRSLVGNDYDCNRVKTSNYATICGWQTSSFYTPLNCCVCCSDNPYFPRNSIYKVLYFPQMNRWHLCIDFSIFTNFWPIFNKIADPLILIMWIFLNFPARFSYVFWNSWNPNEGTFSNKSPGVK